MEGNPSCAPRNRRIQQASRAKVTSTKSRHTVEDGGDLIECSSKHCQSCTAGLIADCVAVCCCPFAVVNLLAFAFIKVPWMVGRRCLGLGKKKSKRLERKRKCKKSDGVFVVESGGNLVKGWVEEGTSEIVSGFGEEDQNDNLSARFEAERVWLELYQVGHLGFGRLSFSGIQSTE